MNIYKDIAETLIEQYNPNNEMTFETIDIPKYHNLNYIINRFWKGLEEFKYIIYEQSAGAYIVNITKYKVNTYDYRCDINVSNNVLSTAIYKALEDLHKEIKAITENKNKIYKTGLKSLTECKYTTKKRSDTGEIQTYINAIKVNGEWQKSHYNLHATGNTVEESQQNAFKKVSKRAAEAELRRKLNGISIGSHTITLEDMDYIGSIEVEVNEDSITLVGYTSREPFNEHFTENITFTGGHIIQDMLQHLIDLNEVLAYEPDQYYFGEYKMFKRHKMLMEAMKPKNKTQIFRFIMDALRDKKAKSVTIELDLPNMSEITFDTYYGMEYEIDEIMFFDKDGNQIKDSNTPVMMRYSQASAVANELALEAMRLNEKQN